MPKLTRRQQCIADVFEAFVEKGETFEWGQVVEAIKKSCTIPTSGWMEVRGVLQLFVNSGDITRVKFDPSNPLAGECYNITKNVVK